MNQQNLEEILEKHSKWLNGVAGGECANLRGADLRGANLCGADLRGANLCDANLRETIANLQCPETGAFIGFKKSRENYIVKLKIPAKAKRSSATSRKCRCSEAKVLSITTIDGKKIDAVATSKHDANFIYVVGETVRVDDFCEDRWQECAPGIHFFITRQEAVDY